MSWNKNNDRYQDDFKLRKLKAVNASWKAKANKELEELEEWDKLEGDIEAEFSESGWSPAEDDIEWTNWKSSHGNNTRH